MSHKNGTISTAKVVVLKKICHLVCDLVAWFSIKQIFQ